MTSSLVGSEMCIRDRIFEGHSMTTTPQDERLRRRPPEAPRGACWAIGAVSYTHLTLPTICSV
eukprot:9519469-Prorocentrum_lima.AAC.1